MESSQYAYTIGEEIVRFTEKDYFRVSVGLMEALNEYGKLVEEMTLDVKLIGNTRVEGVSLNAEQQHLGTIQTYKRDKKEKIKICLQMTRIPSFHKLPKKANAIKSLNKYGSASKFECISSSKKGFFQENGNFDLYSSELKNCLLNPEEIARNCCHITQDNHSKTKTALFNTISNRFTPNEKGAMIGICKTRSSTNLVPGENKNYEKMSVRKAPRKSLFFDKKADMDEKNELLPCLGKTQSTYYLDKNEERTLEEKNLKAKYDLIYKNDEKGKKKKKHKKELVEGNKKIKIKSMGMAKK